MADPKKESVYDCSGYFFGVYNNHLFINNESGGIDIVDITNKSQPFHSTTYNHAEGTAEKILIERGIDYCLEEICGLHSNQRTYNLVKQYLT